MISFTRSRNFEEFGPINILLAPPGCKEVQYDPDAKKKSYFDK